MALPVAPITAQASGVKTVSEARWDELKRHAAVRVEIQLRIAVRSRTLRIARLAQRADDRDQAGER